MFDKAWLERAKAATFAGQLEEADHAFWTAARLNPNYFELLWWGVQMFQPKWLNEPEKLKKALDIYRRIYQGDQPSVAVALNDFALCQHDLGPSQEALTNFVAALEMRRRMYQADHPDVAQSLGNVAACLKNLNTPDRALPCSSWAIPCCACSRLR